EGVGEALQAAPHVTDVGEVALRSEELHAVTSEPRRDVIRVALEVPRDVVLVGVVLGGVDLDLVARLGLVVVDHRLKALLGALVRVVRPERDGRQRAAAATPTAARVVRARREQAGHGNDAGTNRCTTKHGTTRKLARGELGLRHYPSYFVQRMEGWLG